MVADQPLDADRRWPPRSATRSTEVAAALPRWPRSTPSRAAASSCATSRAAGATTPARSTPPSSRGSCSTASRPGSPRRRWRRWPWSPTSSRSVAGPGLGDPRRQRRRRDAHAAHPRPGRGGRARPRDRRATSTAPPATSWSGSASPRSTTCPSSRRSCPTWTTSTTSSERLEARPSAEPVDVTTGDRAVSDRDRRRRPGPAAEAARPVRRRLPPQVRGADARRPGRGRRRGGHPARHQGRPDAPR